METAPCISSSSYCTESHSTNVHSRGTHQARDVVRLDLGDCLSPLSSDRPWPSLRGWEERRRFRRVIEPSKYIKWPGSRRVIFLMLFYAMLCFGMLEDAARLMHTSNTHTHTHVHIYRYICVSISYIYTCPALIYYLYNTNITTVHSCHSISGFWSTIRHDLIYEWLYRVRDITCV